MAVIEFLAAFLAGLISATVFFQSNRSAAHWLLAIGMFTLAVESTFAGLSADAVDLSQRLYWQNCKMLTSTALPAIWISFSLAYARGHGQEALRRWRWPLVGLSA